MVERLKKTDSLSKLIKAYLSSKQFAKLSGAAQKDYEMCLVIVENTKLQTGKTAGETSIMHFSLRHATECYDQWIDRGIYRANKVASILSIVFNWALRRELVTRNPMLGLDRIPNKPRKTMWTPEQVNIFLSTAYKHWKWRSIGIIIQMAYEWGQRVGDMRLLTWDTLDLDAQRMDLEQSKRKADIHLPISDALTHVLRQQKETFGFQDYVAPNITPSDGAYKPYTKQEISMYVNRIKAEAGLPENLTAMDMRRTAITEMVEAGVDITQIKQVSGHKALNSLTPYIKHTFAGASNALAQRASYLKDNSNE